jgi:hypothetical protein
MMQSVEHCYQLAPENLLQPDIAKAPDLRWTAEIL